MPAMIRAPGVVRVQEKLVPVIEDNTDDYSSPREKKRTDSNLRKLHAAVPTRDAKRGQHAVAHNERAATLSPSPLTKLDTKKRNTRIQTPAHNRGSIHNPRLHLTSMFLEVAYAARRTLFRHMPTSLTTRSWKSTKSSMSPLSSRRWAFAATPMNRAKAESPPARKCIPPSYQYTNTHSNTHTHEHLNQAFASKYAKRKN